MNDKLPKDQLELQDRIAALEQKIEVQKFTTQRLIASYDQRLAALEAPSAARQQDFAPGWKNDEEPFMTGVDAPPPDIYFIYPSIESDNKVAVIAQEELIRLVFHYDKAKLEKLIGAALAVLKRMEATPDAKSG